MSENFLKFKKRLNAIRIARAVMAGLAAGMAAGGITLLLSKLAIVDVEQIAALYISIGMLLIVGGLFFLFGGKSDKSFAEELDSQYGLKARVQTMIEYVGEGGDMIALQRQDADSALSKISVKTYKFKGLWIYLTAIALSAAILVSGIIVKDMSNYTPPEEVEAFSLSELQEVGLLELIKYVEKSALEDEFKNPMVEELNSLLERLRVTKTKPDMQIALAETMATLLDITYRSSTATEMLDALWDTGDIYLRYLAKVLDTSSLGTASWGDFAEKLSEYVGILMGDGVEGEEIVVGKDRLKGAISSMDMKLDMAFEASGLPEDDEMYAAVNNIFNNSLVGLSGMLYGIDYMTDDEAREALVTSFNITGQTAFDAIALNKTNASVGEYAMTRLAALFLVPLPEFERPEFFKTGEAVDGSQGSADGDDDEKKPTGGGLGEGITFGSDDYVLDPKTGELKKYGDIIHEYEAIMLERLQGDYYTEEQKEAIKKYFGLLYSGLEEEE